jgi:hypothetical protein
MMARLLKLNGVDHRTVASYHPRANGVVERVNKDIKLMIKKVVDGAMDRWCDHLDFAQFAHNTHIMDRTGSSPFSLMFGRHPNGFRDYTCHTVPMAFDQQQWEKHLGQLNKVIYPSIQQRVSEKNAATAAKFNSTHKLHEFESGQFVMAKDVLRGSKFNAAYEGPFEVIRRNKGGAYLLKDATGSQLPFRFPPSHLKAAPGISKAVEHSYEVLRILQHRGSGHLREYLVKWVNPDIPDSWLSSEFFDQVSIIESYFKSKIKRATRPDNDPPKKKLKLKVSFLQPDGTRYGAVQPSSDGANVTQPVTSSGLVGDL